MDSKVPEGLVGPQINPARKTLAALSHPHIVTIFSVEEAKGVRFLTMELVEGKTLTKVIPRGGLPLPRFFRIAIPLSEAVPTRLPR